jgi:hypothetical protein
MDELGTFMTIGLALYSILRIIKSWGHKKTLAWSVAVAVLGAIFGTLVMGWPSGLIMGLASSAIAPHALAKWINNVPAPTVERVETEENEPPRVGRTGEDR